MRIWTYAEIKAKVELDMDTEGEDFVSDTELMGYVNEAIDEAEAVIHNLNEDYFLNSDLVSVVNGTSDYSMPSDVYANKIRLVQWNDGTNKYAVRRITLEDIPYVESGDDYRYLVLNTASTGPTFRLYPTPAATDSTSLRRYYIRNATRMTATNSNCDIPEFISFVLAFTKVKVALKELNPLVETFQAELEKQRQLMVETLNEMIPDGDNSIPLDLSAYTDMN